MVIKYIAFIAWLHVESHENLALDHSFMFIMLSVLFQYNIQFCSNIRTMFGIDTASRARVGKITIFTKRSKVRKVTTHFCLRAFRLKT